MKYLATIFLLINLNKINAQENCVSLSKPANSICNSKNSSKLIKITGNKNKIINLLEQKKYFVTCNSILGGKSYNDSDFKETKCEENNIRIEFEEIKDFIDFAEISKANENEIEICINSNGEISFTFSNDHGSFSVSSFGKLAISAKDAKGTELKMNLN